MRFENLKMPQNAFASPRVPLEKLTALFHLVVFKGKGANRFKPFLKNVGNLLPRTGRSLGRKRILVHLQLSKHLKMRLRPMLRPRRPSCTLCLKKESPTLATVT